MALAELVGLPDVPVVVFEHTPLVQALCQIQFPIMLSVNDHSVVDHFQRAIKADYPIAGSTGQIQLQFKVGAGDANFNQGSLWNFSDRQGKWKVTLAQDFIAIESRSYQSFEDFLRRLRSVLDAVCEHIDPPVITRIGLRYVNEIRGTNENWDTVIRREMLGPLSTPVIAQHTVQSVQQLALRFPGNQGLNIQHGVLPEGTTVPSRAAAVPEKAPFYLLDIDAFREFPLPGGLEMNLDTICQCVEDFNRVIYRLFRWSTTDAYISSLGVQEREESHGH